MTELTIKRVLPAPIETVFEYITRAERLAEWWGPEGMSLPDATLDFTQTGPWHSVMQNADGARFKVSGQVTRVRPHDRVAFTWAWHDENDQRGYESQVVIDLEPVNEASTRLTLTHTGLADEESARNHEMGWTSSLKKLERSCAA